MAENPNAASIKIVPDTSEFAEALEHQVGSLSFGSKGWDFFWSVAALLLLAAAPALLWAVYGWAF